MNLHDMLVVAGVYGAKLKSRQQRQVEANKRWRRKNRTMFNAQRRRWYARHKDEINALLRKRRAERVSA